MCEGSKKLRCVEYVVGVSLSVCLSHKHPVITEVINKHQAQVSHWHIFEYIYMWPYNLFVTFVGVIEMKKGRLVI